MYNGKVYQTKVAYPLSRYEIFKFFSYSPKPSFLLIRLLKSCISWLKLTAQNYAHSP